MPSLNQTLQALQPYILHQRLPLPPGRDFSQLYILGEEPVDQKFSLYIGTPDSFVRAADALSADKVGFTFVLAGSSPALAAYQQRDDLNLVTTSLSLSSLCNLLYKCFAENDRWARHMYTHLYIKPDLPALLDCGARRLGGFSCLLDPGFKLLGCSGRLVPPIPVLQELVEKTYLPYEDFHLLEWLRTETSSDNWLVPEGCDGSWLMCARQIKYKAQLSAYHLIALPAALCNPATRELAGLFQGWTEQFVTRYNADKYETTGALSSLVADLIEGRLTESEQMVGRLKLLPIHMQKFYHVVVVEPSADADPATLGGLMQALERIFPLALVANYDGHIVILAWKPYHYTPLTYDREALSALLRYYDAYACIGNFTKWLSSLGPLYHQTKRVIKYARAFCEDPEERIFRFEDYSVYQIVDICLEQFRQMDIPLEFVHTGDELDLLGGLKVEILSAYSDRVDELSDDLMNDGAIMFRISGEKDSMLFCSDVGKALTEELIDTYGDKLKSDYVQMGHHGYGGPKAAFYELVAPKAAFFDAPAWLINSDSKRSTKKKMDLMESMGCTIFTFFTAPNQIIIQ